MVDLEQVGPEKPLDVGSLATCTQRRASIPMTPFLEPTFHVRKTGKEAGAETILADYR